MPFQSTAQQRFAFGTRQPWAKRWAKETDFSTLPKRVRPKRKKLKEVSATPAVGGNVHGPGGLMSAPGMGGTRKRKPFKKRTKALTIDQLETFVSSESYDPDTASLIALGIPELPRLKGEQIAPGITRIHGNLCNVHGRYGPCDKALSGKKKPKGGKGRKPAKPRLTPQQRTAQRDQQRQQNVNNVGDQLDASDTLAGIDAYDKGKPIDPAIQKDIINAGLGEIGRDGAMRLTASGREALHAAQNGDVGAARDALSRGRDTRATGQERTTAQHARQTAAAQRQATAQAKRQATQAKRQAAQAAKKPAKTAAGGNKRQAKPAVAKPVKIAMPKRSARVPPSAGGVSSAPSKPKPAAPAKAPAAQIAPALQEAAQQVSDGKPLSDADSQSLIRNGLARLVKGALVLTSSGQRATKKAFIVSPIAETAEPSFRVFKDAKGQYRWVAQSSTAFQDRDKEIVSTKALADDCAFADRTGNYGPLRWWHAPGLDLGDCDFNAMHGRVLIESGTFRTPAIAQKVADKANELEISLGFLHLPTEPDATGVFHHIRRFERSLVPRGKASNRFTAFAVKETPMLDTTKVAALKTLGFSDADIAGLQAQAAATEKSADEQQVAYKADEPVAELPDLTINGITYKAFPPKASAAPAEGSPEEESAETPADEAAEMAAGEAPDADDAGGLTLSPEDIQAIGQAVSDALTQALGPLVSTMDLTNKIGSHMDELKGMMGGYQTKKDSSDAEKAEAITALQTSLKAAETQQLAIKAQLDELLGLQPAVVQRPSESAGTVVNPWTDQHLLGAIKSQVPADQQFEFGDLVTNLFGNINGTPGQA